MTPASLATEAAPFQDQARDIFASIEASQPSRRKPDPIGDIPDLSPAAFAPRDALETMLAHLALAHVRLIVQSANDILAGPSGGAPPKAASQLVALDRVLLGYLRELRIARKRPADILTQGTAEPVPPVEVRAPVPLAATCPRPATPPAAITTAPPNGPGKRALLSGASLVASAAVQPLRAQAAGRSSSPFPPPSAWSMSMAKAGDPSCPTNPTSSPKPTAASP